MVGRCLWVYGQIRVATTSSVNRHHTIPRVMGRTPATNMRTLDCRFDDLVLILPLPLVVSFSRRQRGWIRF